MNDKIEINGVKFNLSSTPNDFFNKHSFGFDLICNHNELMLLKNWFMAKEVFYFEPFSNDVCINQILTTRYFGHTYIVSLTLAKVTKSDLFN